ncbi:MAG: ornithine--oxo-acid transaminase [Actinomycetes bacterium]|jgi:ornithine--oxo-acid transaminase|nr:ornithine--oxo-acid transaminase [Actinomycetes bacterium]
MSVTDTEKSTIPTAAGTPGATAGTSVPNGGRHLAPNYKPLDVTIATAQGSWVTDTAGARYFDALAGYSALNFGHRHPALMAALERQLGRVTLTSRAFQFELMEPYADALVALAAAQGFGALDMMLPMNTGAEAVETALKAARKYAHTVRGIAPDAGTVIVADGNFHGRTTTLISFSTDPDAHAGYGPYTPGFVVVPYGDVAALQAAVDAAGDTLVAVLLETIQGEAGVIVPPADYLPAARTACDAGGALLILDEIQSGLGRTGYTFACQNVGDADDAAGTPTGSDARPVAVCPDLMTLGKALGGGILPVSAVLGRRQVLQVMTAGTHGSTFGGNPLACAVGIAVVDLLQTGEYQRAARELGTIMHTRLQSLVAQGQLVASRGRGLWAGIDLDPARGTGRAFCEQLLSCGVLAKDTHGSTVRLAPPLSTTPDDLNWMLDQFEATARAF